MGFCQTSEGISGNASYLSIHADYQGRGRHKLGVSDSVVVLHKMALFDYILTYFELYKGTHRVW